MRHLSRKVNWKDPLLNLDDDKHVNAKQDETQEICFLCNFQAISHGNLIIVVFISFRRNSYLDNFKKYLVGNTDINTNGDKKIQVSEASAFNGSIYCTNLNISNLKGIEAFSALTYLSCCSNQLTSLDVSKNTALTDLDCGGNKFDCEALKRKYGLKNEDGE